MTNMIEETKPDFEAIKQRQQQAWSSGDFHVVAARIVSTCSPVSFATPCGSSGGTGGGGGWAAINCTGAALGGGAAAMASQHSVASLTCGWPSPPTTNNATAEIAPPTTANRGLLRVLANAWLPIGRGDYRRRARLSQLAAAAVQPPPNPAIEPQHPSSNG